MPSPQRKPLPHLLILIVDQQNLSLPSAASIERLSFWRHITQNKLKTYLHISEHIPIALIVNFLCRNYPWGMTVCNQLYSQLHTIFDKFDKHIHPVLQKNTQPQKITYTLSRFLYAFKVKYMINTLMFYVC